jgi:hypothetical protein
MMASDDDVEKLGCKKICHACVGEEFLSTEISQDGRLLKCSFCGTPKARCYKLDQMADRIDTAFERHYVRTSDQPNDWEYTLCGDKESTFDFDRHGEPVVYAIMNAADIPEQAARDIQAILEERYSDYEADKMGDETAFADDSHYEERRLSDRQWQEQWYSFQRSLKTDARFFNEDGARLLRSVFTNLDQYEAEGGKPLIVKAGPDTEYAAIFRARTFQSDERLEAAMENAAAEFGSPPPRFAASGRMNAHGISVFYGATSPEVALAEVRPPVGSQVAVARFEIIRPLRLLDLTALGETSLSLGSVFDTTLADRIEHQKFLRSLRSHMTRPVMPDDEAIEYLATQAVADFLATSDLKLDGIIFPSVQYSDGAQNIVLFHKAARVEKLVRPHGSKVSASLGSSTEDGWEPHYSISERIPVSQTNKPSYEFNSRWRDSWAPDLDERDPALRIDRQSLVVHVIGAVKFQTDANKVHWNVHEIPMEEKQPHSDDDF